LQRLGVLFLSARALEINDQVTRHGKGDFSAVIFLDESKRQVDSSGDAGRGVERAIF
jgi:hypothetical protein